MCNHQSDVFRNRTDLILCVISYRHEGMGELLLREIKQRIGLILCRRHGVADSISSVGKLFHARVVAGRNVIGSDLQTPLKQGFPFHIAVACNTRIRRAPF